ncbi:MAG: hypothetical protein CVT84_09785 [Alphaproteobacteria bacterium HGW-Alphaproteobacteria-6]|nr:MAG: hypothetical protein CVT84_09785 [Alphaproteobacteria bacterium HGW-Alphaproteobacteria-6]
MKSRLIAAATAAALALGSLSATPAAALDRGERTALTLLLGAAAVGLIVSNNNKRKNDVNRNTVYDPYYQGNNGRFRRGFDDHDNRRFQSVPQHCQRSVRGNDGRRDVISARCLRDAGFRRSLPAHCAFELRDKGRRDTVYGARCLRQEGFRIGQSR